MKMIIKIIFFLIILNSCSSTGGLGIMFGNEYYVKNQKLKGIRKIDSTENCNFIKKEIIYMEDFSVRNDKIYNYYLEKKVFELKANSILKMVEIDTPWYKLPNKTFEAELYNCKEENSLEK